MKTGKKVLLYKSIPYLIFRIPEKGFSFFVLFCFVLFCFFFENFDLLNIFFKLLLSTCLYSNADLKLI